MVKSLRTSLALLLATGLLLPGGCARDAQLRREKERREAFDLLTKGQELKANGDLVLARDTFLKAAEVSSRPIIYYEIGNCHYQLGEPRRAAIYYEKALELAPDFTLARAELDLVRQQLASVGEEPASARRPEPAVVAQAATATPTPPPPVAAATPETTPIASPVAGDPAATPAPSPAPASPTPTPAPARQADPIPESAPAVAAASPTTPPPTQAPAATAIADNVEGAPSVRGPLGGIGSAVQGLSGESPASSTMLAEEVDRQEAVTLLFPELRSDQPVDVAAESAAARRAQELGRFDEAVRTWGRVLSIEPTNIDARLGLAEALQRSGRSRRAEEEYLRATTLSPNNADVYFGLGNYYVREKETQKARDAFDRTLAIDPAHYRASNNLAALLMQTGNAELAVQRLEALVAAQPSFPSAWLNLALARDNAGRPKNEVLVALENYLRLSGTPDPRSERWLAELRTAPAAPLLP